jgi:hypothetical protein
MTRWFGPWWNAPALDDAEPTLTPVGSPCIDCSEPILSGDQGFIQPCVFSETEVQYLPIHRECRLLSVVGHSYGWCRCTDYHGLTRREAALRLWEELRSDRGLRILG